MAAIANDFDDEIDMSTMPEDEERFGAILEDEAGSGRLFRVGDHVELAHALRATLGDSADLVADEMAAWRFDGALWREIDRSMQSRVVQSFSGCPVGKKDLKIKATDVAGAIKLFRDQIARPGFFADAPPAIAFSDCVVRVGDSGLEVVPHGRDNRVRAGFPFPYQRRACPRRFLAFLGELWRDDEDRSEKEDFVQEFFGACELGIAPRYQKAGVAPGLGSNGKTTLAVTLSDCMPAGTTSAIAPQDLGQEYRRAMLAGKHLNIVSELPERDIIASEAFKAIVTGDPIIGRVIRESPIMFRPKAGHFFAANKLPGTTDQSEGFWRRFVVLTFNRSFENDPGRDPNLVPKLLEEKAAIVSWLLDGAERLIRQKSYTIPASHHAAMAAWRRNADQVALFVESELRPTREREHGTAGAALYSAYREWCERNGHRYTLASNRFAERMQALDLGARKTKAGMVYPVMTLTAAERAAGVQGGAGSVQGHPPPVTVEDSNGS